MHKNYLFIALIALTCNLWAGDKPQSLELTEFNAVQNGDVVNLNWAIDTKVNNALITIERSFDGNNWEEILYMDQVDNNSTYVEYFDVDATPTTGYNYYRIKQTEEDGTIGYSNIAKVEYKADNGLYEVFPNPNDGIYFDMNLEKYDNKEALLVVRNPMGQELYSKAFFSNEGQLFSIDLDHQLPEGTYLVIASSEDELVSRKLVVE